MKLSITTKLDKSINESLGNKTILNNTFSGSSIPSLSPQGQEMIIDQADSKEWILDASTGAAFDLDLLTVLNTTIDKIKFIHIQCYKNFQSVGDVPAPIRFSLNIDGTLLGKLSQFQIANADSLTAANITVSAIEVTGDEQAVLQVVFGIKS